MPSFILQTKLTQPPLPPKWIRRPAILQTLDEGLQNGRQITLISAPAGYGKTTLAAEWLSSLKIPAVWLSLETADDEPLRFYSYLLAALQKTLPGLGQELSAVLRSGEIPPPENFAGVLINEILLFNHPILLALDDFHTIQAAPILEFFRQLVNNQPPCLHLLFLTREDPSLPLAKLRAEGKLNELRGKDLCFSEDETGQFFKEVIGLNLAEKDLSTLEKKTEGWPAGLQLAGLSLRSGQDPGRIIENLSGSHHFILNYLSDQVLNQQPADVRLFLQQTSILERLNGDLCDVLTQRKDSKSLLDKLYRANLFLIPLDEEHKWYRYHPLFADLLAELRSTQEIEQSVFLHQRASRWYREAGLAPEAIRHALQGKDYQNAVELLEEHAAEMIMLGYARTVNTWLQAIPREQRLKSVKTGLALAWAYLLRGDYSHVNAHIQELEETFLLSAEREHSPAIQAEWLVLQAFMRYMHRDLSACSQLAAQALEISPQESKRVRSLAHYVLASVYQARKDYLQAEAQYENSLRTGRESGNRFAEIMSTISLSEIMLAAGQLQRAHETCSRTLSRLEEAGELPLLSAFLYLTLADIHYQRYQLEESLKNTRRSLQLSSLGGYNTSLIFSFIHLSRLQLVKQDPEAAENEVQKALELLPDPAPEYVRQDISSQLVRVALSRAQPETARAVLAKHGFSFEKIFSFPEYKPEEANPLSAGQLSSCAIQALLAQAPSMPDLKIALALAEHLLEGSSPATPYQVRLEASLLAARIHTQLKDTPSARTNLLQAIKLAAPQGYLQVFADLAGELVPLLKKLCSSTALTRDESSFIQQILQVFSRQNPKGNLKEKIGTEAPVEQLTSREVEVLNLMESGLKYKEIAAELVISLNTVRFHVKTIYGKLQVNTRTQAILKARQHHIL